MIAKKFFLSLFIISKTVFCSDPVAKSITIHNILATKVGIDQEILIDLGRSKEEVETLPSISHLKCIVNKLPVEYLREYFGEDIITHFAAGMTDEELINAKYILYPNKEVAQAKETVLKRCLKDKFNLMIAGIDGCIGCYKSLISVRPDDL